MAKELTWHGKSEEEVKKLDLKEFMNYVPARQRRSLKRGFTDAQKSLLKRIDAGANNIKTHCRDIVIIPSMLGKTFRVYTGKDFFIFTVTLEMLGHSFGEFAHTRMFRSHGGKQAKLSK